jgi:hypothetical protein
VHSLHPLRATDSVSTQIGVHNIGIGTQME